MPSSFLQNNFIVHKVIILPKIMASDPKKMFNTKFYMYSIILIVGILDYTHAPCTDNI